MSHTALPRLARRILGRPHFIAPAAARAVLVALGPRLGLDYLVDLDGRVLRIAEAEPPETAGRSLTPERDWDDPDHRPFAFDRESGIAWIPIEGELVHRFGHLDPWSGMTGYDAVKLKVQAAAEDPEVKGILLDVDSPGGEVYGVEGAAQAIIEARVAKPVWALANEQMLSAALWLGSAAHVVILPTLADIGSIGAVILHEDIEGLVEGLGVRITLIHAPEGGHKIDAHPFRELLPEDRAWLQGRANLAYRRFADSVARNRNLPVAAIDATQARVLTGPEAVEAGLADAVASEDEVWSEFAARLARQARTLVA